MELDEVADELYEVPPEEFVAVRTARQDDAKAAGDKALAKQIGALPKPSSAAWACNLLVHAHRAEIEGLVELGTLLREAQDNLAGDELKALDVQRRQLLSALTRQARALAHERGHPVSSAVATQVEETLRAAMSDPEAGEALLSGRLSSPMSYSGMGELVGRPKLHLVPPPEPAERTSAKRPAPRKPAGESAADRRAREQEERRQAAEAKRQRELAQARAAADEAEAAAEDAESALREHRRAAEELAARRAELQERVEELADQLAEAEREAAEAATALKREERRLAGAERAAAEAAEVREHALARVAQLSEAD